MAIPLFNIKKEDANKSFACGTQLFFKSGNGAVCGGHFCTPTGAQTQTCLKDPGTKTYTCIKADISGWITNSEWDIPWYKSWESEVDVVDDLEVHLVCADGEKIELDSDENIVVTKNNKLAQYSVVVTEVSTSEEAKKLCFGNNALGLILYPDFDENLDPFDEAHYIGIDPNKKNIGKDLGDSDTKFFEAIKNKTPYKNIAAHLFLIDLKALDTGYELNIDAGTIKDID
jgi:hypothetical protein